MEAATIYGISSGVSAVAGSPLTSMFSSWLTSWFLKRKLKKRLTGLLIMKGVSTLCQKLTTQTHLYLDVDKLFQNLTAPKSAEEVNERSVVDDYLAYPIIKNHIANIATVFKGDIILVSRSIELLHAMPIYQNSIVFGCFSKEMEDNVGGVIYNGSKDEHHEAVVEKFRILRELPQQQIIMVNTLNELYDKVAERFHSKRISV